MREVIGEFSLNLEIPDFGIFPGGLEPGRYPRGFLDPVGSILVEYLPKPGHMDLIRTRFHDFHPKSGISVPKAHVGGSRGS